MESTITGTVESVEGRTTRTGPIYDVVIGGQKFSTFKQPIAEQANALKGSTVAANVKIEQKGDYTNYTLLGVELVDAGGTGTASLIPVQSSSNASNSSTIPVAPQQGGMSPDREAKIVRQSSMATAFNYAAHAGLSEDEAFALAGRIYSRAMGNKDAGLPEAELAGVARETTEDIPW